MPVEKPFLTDLMITSLSTELPLSNFQRRDLQTGIRSRGVIQRTIQDVVDKFACQVEGFAFGIHERLSEAEALLTKTKRTVSADQSSWQVVLRETRRSVLTDPNFRPPLILQPLRLFAIREPHPLVLARQLERDAAKEDFDSAEVKTEELGRGMFPQIDRGYDDLERVEGGMLSVYRRAASTSDSALETFVTVIPWQAQRVVSEYVQLVAGSDQQLATFQEFVNFMYGRFKYTRNLPSYNMTPDGYEKLDSRVKNCWGAFVEYRKLTGFAQRNLVPEPQVPDVIDRLGASLNI